MLRFLEQNCKISIRSRQRTHILNPGAELRMTATFRRMCAPEHRLPLENNILFWRDSPPVGQGLLIHEVSRSHATTHHSRYDSSGRMISSSQRPLPDNTQHSQQKNVHAPGGIRNQNLSRRAAADPRLRPRGHWDRPFI
jgi:hypothetical protein